MAAAGIQILLLYVVLLTAALYPLWWGVRVSRLQNDLLDLLGELRESARGLGKPLETPAYLAAREDLHLLIGAAPRLSLPAFRAAATANLGLIPYAYDPELQTVIDEVYRKADRRLQRYLIREKVWRWVGRAQRGTGIPTAAQIATLARQ